MRGAIYLGILLLMMGKGMAQRLVLPGDNPDPSVVKIGDNYWASATTSNWMPAFPLFKSNDLKTWQTVGHIFKVLPTWADYYFWAPEISYDNGKVYVYYSAHKKNGNLCVGIASADKPEGPYKDHGPLICEEAGSIDAFPMRDEAGKLHLVWKEDGNSVGKPTPIWIQELNEERTAVLGQKKLLFRNDAPWEGNLVEGVSMMRHGNYLYAFYAAAGCCGRGCDYQSGIARSKTLAGPWEKYANNPVLVNEGQWTCPGHGTPVQKDGKFYFLYHAYDSSGTVYTGRQGILKEFVFTGDDWIKFVDETNTLVPAPYTVSDKFNGTALHNDWQWSVFNAAKHRVEKGELSLTALPGSASFVARKASFTNYTVGVKVLRKKSGAAAGISLVGDDKNLVAAYIYNDSVLLVQTKEGRDSLLLVNNFAPSKNAYLRMQITNGKDVKFYYGNNKRSLKLMNPQPVDAAYLPPWDRALRVALITKAGEGKAVFDCFEMKDDSR